MSLARCYPLILRFPFFLSPKRCVMIFIPLLTFHIPTNVISISGCEQALIISAARCATRRVFRGSGTNNYQYKTPCRLALQGSSTSNYQYKTLCRLLFPEVLIDRVCSQVMISGALVTIPL